MWQRLFEGAVVVAAMAVMGAPLVVAEDKEGTHEGLVVAVEGDKLTMTDKDGKNEHTHTVPQDASITCDGKACRLADLKKGFSIKVTIEKKGKGNAVTRIDAKKENP